MYDRIARYRRGGIFWNDDSGWSPSLIKSPRRNPTPHRNARASVSAISAASALRAHLRGTNRYQALPLDPNAIVLKLSQPRKHAFASPRPGAHSHPRSRPEPIQAKKQDKQDVHKYGFDDGREWVVFPPYLISQFNQLQSATNLQSPFTLQLLDRNTCP